MQTVNSAFFCRAFLATALALAMIGAPLSAQAATPAEQLVSDNIQKGFDVLNDMKLTPDQRHERFQGFLLGVMDLTRVATFTLGPYAPKASQADRDAFAAAFRRFAVAVYQSFFAKYAGQTLKVVGSHSNAPGDDIVATILVDPSDNSGKPVEIDFRVRSDTGTAAIVDISVSGMWLAIEERDQFTSFLDKNRGDIALLIAHLDDLRGKLVAAD
jgi:phospholipid transport system substrate-binding protein